MEVFDKDEIKSKLTNENIFELLQDFRADPVYRGGYTVCHNEPNMGSAKLYYYFNTQLFRCYSGCDEPNFDVFEFVIKVKAIQEQRTMVLNDAVRWVAQRFGIAGHYQELGKEQLEDWKYLDNYDRIKDILSQKMSSYITLPEYDRSILKRFNYKIRLSPWLREGISEESIRYNNIGYYPAEDQITIPHYDKDGRFIGLRGRTLCKTEAENYGKYRPIRIGSTIYSHPLGLNLYNLNNSKYAIKILRKAIVFESEKACLQYASFFGHDNDISVACCGSNLSTHQVQLLLDAGAEEIVIGFDRQFQRIGDEEYIKLKRNLLKTRDKYKNSAQISFIFDNKMITQYKDSPTDRGSDTFLKLYNERIRL